MKRNREAYEEIESENVLGREDSDSSADEKMNICEDNGSCL